MGQWRGGGKEDEDGGETEIVLCFGMGKGVGGVELQGPGIELEDDVVRKRDLEDGEGRLGP